LAQHFDAYGREQVLKLQKLAGFHAKFELLRTGEIEITHDVAGRTSPQSLTPPTGPRGNRFIHSICAQLYFFLKDICHRHQHHHPTTDTIIDLYRADDDVEWRN